MQKEQHNLSGGHGARLSKTEFLIMQLLVEAGKNGKYGLQLVEESNGLLKKGTVYVLLGRLEDKGFIDGKFHLGGSPIPRKLYKTTGLGQKVYAAWRSIVQLGGLAGAIA